MAHGNSNDSSLSVFTGKQFQILIELMFNRFVRKCLKQHWSSY